MAVRRRVQPSGRRTVRPRRSTGRRPVARPRVPLAARRRPSATVTRRRPAPVARRAAVPRPVRRVGRPVRRQARSRHLPEPSRGARLTHRNALMHRRQAVSAREAEFQRRVMLHQYVPATHIEGPISLTLHTSAALNKVIYVFGDHHVRKSVCSYPGAQRIDQFLVSTILANAKAHPRRTIDLYLEHGLRKKYERDVDRVADLDQGFLFGNVRQEFNRCLRISKETCHLHNARVHYADARWALSLWNLLQTDRRTSGIVIDLITLTLRFLTAVRERTEATFSWQDLVGLVDRLRAHIVLVREALRETESEDFGQVDVLLRSAKVTRQWSQIRNAQVRQTLDQHFMTIYNNSRVTPAEFRVWLDHLQVAIDDGIILLQIRTPNVMVPGIDRAIEHLSNVLSDESRPLYKRLSDLTLAIMDGYLIGRVFRSFNARGGRPAQDPEFIVIYAGDAHSRNYRELLTTKLGFNTVAETASEQQCIDMSGFRQPFFL